MDTLETSRNSNHSRSSLRRLPLPPSNNIRRFQLKDSTFLVTNSNKTRIPPLLLLLRFSTHKTRSNRFRVVVSLKVKGREWHNRCCLPRRQCLPIAGRRGMWAEAPPIDGSGVGMNMGMGPGMGMGELVAAVVQVVQAEG